MDGKQNEKMNFPGCEVVLNRLSEPKDCGKRSFSFSDRVDVEKIEKQMFKTIITRKCSLRRNVACPVITLEPICSTSHYISFAILQANIPATSRHVTFTQKMTPKKNHRKQTWKENQSEKMNFPGCGAVRNR